MAKRASPNKPAPPKRVRQRPPGPPDVPPQAPEPSATPGEAEPGQRRSVYRRRTQPGTARRTKTRLIDREGQSVPGEAEAEEYERQP